jgi:hypothetical protein
MRQSISVRSSTSLESSLQSAQNCSISRPTIEFIDISLSLALSYLYLMEISGHSGVGTGSFVVDGLVLGAVSNGSGEGILDSVNTRFDLGSSAVVLFDALEMLNGGYFLITRREILVYPVGKGVVWLGRHRNCSHEKGKEEDDEGMHVETAI